MPDEPTIFISYRRRDAGGHGRALHEYLSGRFGDDCVYDFVRREIALALEQGKKVIPVLFDDAPVPPRDWLPDPLQVSASCDALTLAAKPTSTRPRLISCVGPG